MLTTLVFLEGLPPEPGIALFVGVGVLMVVLGAFRRSRSH